MNINDFDYSCVIGKVLKKVYIHYVKPEINVVWLEFEDMVLQVFGLEGSELLGVSTFEKEKISFISEEVFEFKEFIRFFNKELLQVHLIGSVWNGHGLEISFKGMIYETMIIQSIYSGDKPTGFEDCLRLGISNYQYRYGDYLSGASIKKVIDEWDPIELLSYAPEDEYEEEILMIHARSVGINEIDDLGVIIHDVFIETFGPSVYTKELDDAKIIAGKILTNLPAIS